MPNLIDLVSHRKPTSEKICTAGLVRINMDDTLQSSTNILETLKSDHADFEEIKLSLNMEEFEYDMTP